MEHPLSARTEDAAPGGLARAARTCALVRAYTCSGAGAFSRRAPFSLSADARRHLQHLSALGRPADDQLGELMAVTGWHVGDRANRGAMMWTAPVPNPPGVEVQTALVDEARSTGGARPSALARVPPGAPFGRL